MDTKAVHQLINAICIDSPAASIASSLFSNYTQIVMQKDKDCVIGIARNLSLYI